MIALPTDGARRPMTSEAAFPTSRRTHVPLVHQRFTGRRSSEGDAADPPFSDEDLTAGSRSLACPSSPNPLNRRPSADFPINTPRASVEPQQQAGGVTIGVEYELPATVPSEIPRV